LRGKVILDEMGECRGEWWITGIYWRGCASKVKLRLVKTKGAVQESWQNVDI